MAGKNKRKRMQKIIHVLHTLFEFLLKLKKAIGKSPAGHSAKKAAAKGKTAAKSAKAAVNPSNPLVNPISQAITKVLASAGATVSSSTATVAVIGAVIVIGGAVVYEYGTNPGFAPNVPDSVGTILNTFTGNLNPNGVTPGSNTNNPLSLGVGTGNTNPNTNNPLSLGVGTGNTNPNTNNGASSESSGATKPSSSGSGSGSSESSNNGVDAPSIDFEIPDDNT